MRILSKKYKFLLFILTAVIVSTIACFSIASAANVYVDNTLNSNCVSGNYSTSTRNCSGGDGNAYNTIQEAITNCSIGDTIYMRGGTYNEVGIHIDDTKNGTAWTANNFTTLKSYPNEWAIVDASGLGMSDHWTDQAVFTRPTGYGVDTSNQSTKYWKFEKFEITGGRTGFFLKGDHLWFRYLYIHDNGRDFGDSLQAGILMPIPRSSIIEYCYLKDNEAPFGSGSRNNNNNNILFDGDYRDNDNNGGNGDQFDLDASTNSNIIRYNLLDGSLRSLHYKNQQRFGYNNRDPDDMTYEEFGDKIHHNIIINSESQSIVTGQDFTQIYNNIVDNSIYSSDNGDVPIVYNNVIYNNTSITAEGALLVNSGLTTSGDTKLNYYDNAGQQTVHEHLWVYNNVMSGGGNSWHQQPFVIAWDMPENSTNPNWDMSDLVVENNLIHDSAKTNSSTFIIGHNYDAGFTSCDYQYQDTSLFNSCSALWRGIGSVTNWDNTNPGLFAGTTGADQYIANGSFILSGLTTISNGGKGSNHPYLSNVTIPNYVGATNPDDHDWVAGILDDISSTTWLRTQSDDPSWIEGSSTSSSPSICTSFVYSDWNNCQSDDTQTRTVLSSDPMGCSGGDPLTTQSCTYNGDSDNNNTVTDSETIDISPIVMKSGSTSETIKKKSSAHSKKKRIKFKGTATGLSGGSVKIYSGSKLKKESTVDANGKWSVKVKEKKNGSYTYKIKFYNSEGEKIKTKTRKVRIDTKKPKFINLSNFLNKRRGSFVWWDVSDNYKIRKTKIYFNGKKYNLKTRSKKGETIRSQFQIPTDTPAGTYILKIKVYDKAGNRKIGYTTVRVR